MNHWLAASSVCVVIAIVPAVRADDDAVRAKLDKAKADFEVEATKYRTAVAAWFDKREETARKSGDKKNVDQVKTEREAFDETGELPNSAPNSIKSRYASARSGLERAYQNAIRDYTKSKEDDAAMAVEMELVEFQKSGEGPSNVRFNDDVSISAKSEHGHVVGQISKGEKVVLQYVSGKWKSWGNRATESPDAIVQEANDKCRLVICEAAPKGGTRVLAVVGPGTMVKPFEWVADRDYEKLVLRINDSDGDFATNPDGGVKYRLQVLKAK